MGCFCIDLILIVIICVVCEKTSRGWDGTTKGYGKLVVARYLEWSCMELVLFLRPIIAVVSPITLFNYLFSVVY